MKKYTFKETRVRQNVYSKTFSPDIEADNLVWHRDAEERKILIEVGLAKVLKDFAKGKNYEQAN